MSAATGWAEELGAGLEDEGAPETGRGTLGLLALLLVLAGGVALARALPEQLIERERAAQETPQEQRRRAIQEALDAKAQGRYREAWDALRELHDQRLRDPVVNLELAVLHEQIGNLDFAREYLALVEEQPPVPPRGRLLRARLELARAHELHRAATRTGVAPGRALEHLAAARAALELAEERRPRGATLDTPHPILRELAEGIRRQGLLIRLKEAKLWAAGTNAQRARARRAIEELLAEEDLAPDVRRQAEEVRDHLRAEPVIWRSGS